MAKGVWQLTVTKDFSASHALRNYQGKCETLHGHNFGVQAVVEGDTLDPDVEYVVDFSVLKTALAEAIEPLDHAHLNETPPFDVKNPSSENLALYVYKRLQPGVEKHGVRLVAVTVSEKAGQSATYREISTPDAREAGP